MKTRILMSKLEGSMKIVGILVALVAIYLGIALAGSLGMFIDIPSLLIVVFPAIGFSIFRFGSRVFKFGSQTKEVKYSILRSIGKNSLVSGVLGAVIGLIQLGNSLGDDLTVIGPGCAVALITIVYGCLINLIMVNISQN